MIMKRFFGIFGVRNSEKTLEITTKSVAKNTIFYFVASIVMGLSNFILVPFYTRSLGLSDFGVYVLIDIAILILVTVTRLGSGVSYLKWFANSEGQQQDELLWTTFIYSIVASIIGGGLLWLLTPILISNEQNPSGHLAFSWMLMPIILIENVQGLFFNDLRARQLSFVYVLTAIVRLIATTVVTLICMISLDMGLRGVFLGRLIGGGITVLFSGIVCLKAVTPSFSLSLAKDMIKYGLPLVWSTLLILFMDASGRYFLAYFNDLEQAGIYGVALKISSIFQIVIVQPFGMVWGGIMFQISKLPNARLLYSKVYAYVFVFAIAAALVLSIMSPTLFMIFAPGSYSVALTVFPLILLIRAVSMLEYPATMGLYIEAKTRNFVPIYTIGFIVNIALSFLLVPNYGVFGVGLSWLASWLIIIIMITISAHKYYPLNYDWFAFIVPIALWLIAVSFRYFDIDIMNQPLWLQMLSMSVVIIVTLGFIGWDMKRSKVFIFNKDTVVNAIK